jgi:hypothetical protein
MRVYDLRDHAGRLFAFEVSGTFIGRHGLVSIVQGMADAHITRLPQRLSPFREQEFCEFEVNGRRFVLAESPFDSSYWIGMTPPAPCPELDTVRDAFVQASPWAAMWAGGIFGWLWK